MTTVDPFQAAMDKRKERKKDEEESKNKDYTNYQETVYLGLEDDKEKVFRILGLPWDTRQNPTDVKLILQSQILRDDKKGYTYINWPWVVKNGKIVPDPDWFLTKILDKIREGKWRKYDESDLSREGFRKDRDGNVVNKDNKKGEFENYHTHTESYRRITSKGNSKAGEKYFKNFYPSKHILMNVIDRLDDYCQKNKKTKILSTKVSPYTFTDEKTGEEKTIFYATTGVSLTLYDKIFNHVMDFRGNWFLDLVVKKYKTGEGEQRDYIIKDATDDKKLSPEIAAICTDAPLTAEELEYELYNFDEGQFAVSSASKIKKNLSSFIKQADIDFPEEGFQDELDRLVAKEKEEIEKKKKEANNPEAESRESAKEEKAESPKEESAPEPQKEKAEEPVKEEAKAPDPEVAEEPERKRRNESDSSSEPTIEELCKQNFPKWDFVPEKEQKKIVENISAFNGKVPVWVNPSDPILCPNKYCNFIDSDERSKFPSTVYTCPVCGTVDK